MGRTYTETRIGREADITFSRRIEEGVVRWSLEVSVWVLESDGSVIRRASIPLSLQSDFSAAERTQISSVRDLIVQKVLSKLAVSDS